MGLSVAAGEQGVWVGAGPEARNPGDWTPEPLPCALGGTYLTRMATPTSSRLA